MPGPHFSQSELKVLLSQHPGGEAMCVCLCVCVREFCHLQGDFGKFSLIARGKFSIEVCKNSCEFESVKEWCVL